MHTRRVPGRDREQRREAIEDREMRDQQRDAQPVIRRPDSGMRIRCASQVRNDKQRRKDRDIKDHAEPARQEKRRPRDAVLPRSRWLRPGIQKRRQESRRSRREPAARQPYRPRCRRARIEDLATASKEYDGANQFGLSGVPECCWIQSVRSSQDRHVIAAATVSSCQQRPSGPTPTPAGTRRG